LHPRRWLPLRLPGSGDQICPWVLTGTLLPKRTLELMLFDSVVTFGSFMRCCMERRLQSESMLKVVATVSTLCLCVLCVFTAPVAGELPLELQALDNMQMAAMQQCHYSLTLFDVIGRAPLSPEEAVPSLAVPGAIAVPSRICA